LSRIETKRTEEKEQRVRDALAVAEQLLDGVAPELDLSALPAFLRAPGDAGRRSSEFWLRMLHSALVDADCLDTEAHFNPERNEERSADKPTIEELWNRFEAKQNTMLSSAPATALNAVRAEIYHHCLHAAELPQGVFSL